MRGRAHKSFIVPVLLFGLLSVACTSSASDSSTSGDGYDSTQVASGPIARYFEQAGGFEAAVANYRQLVEESILLCVARQGFDYVILRKDVAESDSALLSLSRQEWKAEHGYAISTLFREDFTDLGTNPNWDSVAAISTQQREQWLETLTGRRAGGEFDLAIPLQQQGCVGEGIEETGGAEMSQGFVDFEDDYYLGLAALLDLPEVVSATGEWERCMADSGYVGLSGGLAGSTSPLEEAANVLLRLQAREFRMAAADLACMSSYQIPGARTQRAGELGLVGLVGVLPGLVTSTAAL